MLSTCAATRSSARRAATRALHRLATTTPTRSRASGPSNRYRMPRRTGNPPRGARTRGTPTGRRYNTAWAGTPDVRPPFRRGANVAVSVAVVGATGAVGDLMRKVLHERNFPAGTIKF